MNEYKLSESVSVTAYIRVSIYCQRDVTVCISTVFWLCMATVTKYDTAAHYARQCRTW